MRDNKNFFHPKSKLHAMQFVGTHNILFSSFIKTLLLFLLAYVRETTCKIKQATDHSITLNILMQEEATPLISQKLKFLMLQN